MDMEEEDRITKRLWQFFWGSPGSPEGLRVSYRAFFVRQQRFFKALCNSCKVPAACEVAEEAVEKGQQVGLGSKWVGNSMYFVLFPWFHDVVCVSRDSKTALWRL